MHTPGPWAFADDIGKPHKLKRDGGRGMSIAYVRQGMVSDEEHEANRKLMETAPDLLWALRDVHADLDHGPVEECGCNYALIIAKAEGS